MDLSAEFYKTLLDNLSDGVYFLDRSRKITYWNKGAERITGYSSQEVLGFCCGDNILMHVNDQGESMCRNHCPAAAAMAERKPRYSEVYLRHKDGHRVPVATRINPIIDGEGNTIGVVEIFSGNFSKVKLVETIEELKQLALNDSLTELGNRRFGEMKLYAMLNEYRRYGWQFGVLFIDIDHFKSINDALGHDVGDRVLQMVARTLANNVRSFDLVCRWGGEEFVVLITSITLDRLVSIAEKLRALVAESSFMVNGEPVRATVSIGATLVHSEDTEESLVKRADELMYQSKQQGRNRVTSS